MGLLQGLLNPRLGSCWDDTPCVCPMVGLDYVLGLRGRENATDSIRRIKVLSISVNKQMSPQRFF